MKNILGRWDRSKIIEDELTSLGIKVVHNDNKMFAIFGRLGNHEFFRGPDFWVIKGKTPLITAEKLYNHSLGHAHILVVGNNTRPSPSEKRNNDLVHEGKFLAGKGAYRWATLDPHLGWIIPSYKIISFPATQLFIDTLKEDKVIK